MRLVIAPVLRPVIVEANALQSMISDSLDLFHGGGQFSQTHFIPRLFALMPFTRRVEILEDMQDGIVSTTYRGLLIHSLEHDVIEQIRSQPRSYRTSNAHTDLLPNNVGTVLRWLVKKASSSVLTF